MHLFVCHKAICKPLQPPYDGPCHLLKRSDKHYTLDITGRLEVVLLYHLKPAYLESDLVTGVNTSTQATSTAQPTKFSVTISCSGRRVRLLECSS